MTDQNNTLDKKMIFECGKCKHHWLVTYPLPMPVNAFVIRMKAESVCPKCGKKGAFILLGERYQAALKELEVNGK